MSVTLADARPFGVMSRGNVKRFQLLGEVRDECKLLTELYIDGKYSDPTELDEQTFLEEPGNNPPAEWEMPERDVNAVGWKFTVESATDEANEGIVLHAIGLRDPACSVGRVWAPIGERRKGVDKMPRAKAQKVTPPKRYALTSLAVGPTRETLGTPADEAPKYTQPLAWNEQAPELDAQYEALEGPDSSGGALEQAQRDYETYQDTATRDRVAALQEPTFGQRMVAGLQSLGGQPGSLDATYDALEEQPPDGAQGAEPTFWNRLQSASAGLSAPSGQPYGTEQSAAGRRRLRGQ